MSFLYRCIIYYLLNLCLSSYQFHQQFLLAVYRRTRHKNCPVFTCQPQKLLSCTFSCILPAMTPSHPYPTFCLYLLTLIWLSEGITEDQACKKGLDIVLCQRPPSMLLAPSRWSIFMLVHSTLVCVHFVFSHCDEKKMFRDYFIYNNIMPSSPLHLEAKTPQGKEDFSNDFLISVLQQFNLQKKYQGWSWVFQWYQPHFCQ